MLLKALLPAQSFPHSAPLALLEPSVGAVHEYELWKCLVTHAMSPWGRTL